MIDWNDDRVATLRKLWAEGLTCQQIGRVIGCTRNAVIGKAHRLGLPERAPNMSRAHLASRLAARKTGMGRGNKLGRRSSPITPYKPVIRPQTNVSVIALNVGLLDLVPGMCRWPVNDDRPHMFCAQPWDGENGPYCRAHHALAHTAQQPKKKIKRKHKPDDRAFERWAA